MTRNTNQAHRQDVGQQQAQPAREGRGLDVVGGREVGAGGGQREDQERVERGEDQARQEARDQQLADVDAGERAEQHSERGGRDQHGEAADAEDRADRHDAVIAAPGHLGDHQRAEECCARHARAGERGEGGAAGDGDEGEARRHAAHQLVDRVEHAPRQAGVEEQFAHQQEQRHRGERERGQRRGAVVDQLRKPALAAEEQERAQKVGGDEGERDRQPERHQGEHRADHQGERFVPGHARAEFQEVAGPGGVCAPLRGGIKEGVRRRWRAGAAGSGPRAGAIGTGADRSTPRG
jgi:hypothetical protein